MDVLRRGGVDERLCCAFTKRARLGTVPPKTRREAAFVRNVTA